MRSAPRPRHAPPTRWTHPRRIPQTRPVQTNYRAVATDLLTLLACVVGGLAASYALAVVLLDALTALTGGR